MADACARNFVLCLLSSPGGPVADADAKIRVGLEVAATTGWVGFGVSESGGMEGADIALLTKAGASWTVQDSCVAPCIPTTIMHTRPSRS